MSNTTPAYSARPPAYEPSDPTLTASPQVTLLGQALAALAGGVVLLALLVLLLPFGYSLVYAGRVFPGVSVAGVDLSGMSMAEAAATLAQRLDYPERGRIVFQESDQVWSARPSELGLVLDYPTSAQAAYKWGRSGRLAERFSAQWQAWSQGVDLPPVFIFDERTAQSYLQGIAAQVDRPIIEASLTVSGVEVIVHPGQVGRTLDIEAALAALRGHLPSLSDAIIPLIVHETPPMIFDASEQAELARAILSAPLTLTVPSAEAGDPGPWVFEPAALAEMLTIERVAAAEGARYQVGLKTDGLRAFLEGLAPSFARSPANARFVFDDETHQLEVLQPSVVGRSLDVETTIQTINQKLITGEHTIPLDIDYTNPPAPDTATAESLGVRELVSSYTSYFYGSSAARIQNITLAAARFHGVLVPPGATFSMAEVLGDVSLDAGYAEALIIFGDRTIKGVGGGVCQVSTTLFRTAFFGGYPIVERYAHAYRVSYYELTRSGGVDTRLAGLDATVFAPVVDFKFTNDRSSWLLMETYVDQAARTLTWKFYSSDDGRTVQWDTTGPTNIVEPPEPRYEFNPDLPDGEIKQVDWAAQGADVTVTRTVIKDGQVYFTDRFFTHYLPWQAVYQYGEGAEVPTPEPTQEP